MSPIYVIQSLDSFLIEKKIEEIKKKYQIDLGSISNYDLEEHTLEQVLEDLDTYSFLTPMKCIIVSNPTFLTTEGGKINEDTLEHFERYLDHPINEHILILIISKLDERKKIVKKLKKIATFYQLEQDPIAYVKEALKGYQLTPGSLSMLVEYCNHNISKLSQECEKLKLYCLDSHLIRKEDIEELVERELDDSDTYVFSFVNALVLKNKKESLQIYHNLLKLGLDPIAIVTLVANQFRLIYQVKILTEERHNKEEIAKILECHPYRVEKAKMSAMTYLENELLDYLVKLADLDLKMKTGKMDSSEALEMFILEM